MTAPAGHCIRATRAADVPLLPAIERDAANLFRSMGRWSMAYEQVRSAEEHIFGLAHGMHWVAADADDRPCGFALGALADGHLHLLELGVARACQRRGLGTALLAAVIDGARRRSDPLVTLTTERDLPWNGPFYRRHGFVEVPGEALALDLSQLLAADLAAGLDAATRCAMARPL